MPKIQSHADSLMSVFLFHDYTIVTQYTTRKKPESRTKASSMLVIDILPPDVRVKISSTPLRAGVLICLRIHNVGAIKVWKKL